MSFLDIALPAVQRWGLPIIPRSRDSKRPLKWGACDRTNTEEGVRAFAAQVPSDTNYSICSDERFTILESDDEDRFRQLVREATLKIYGEVRELPVTLTSYGRLNHPHWFFERTVERKPAPHCHGVFEWRHNNEYVAGFGSTHHSGSLYTLVDENTPIAPFPLWLPKVLDYIKQTTPVHASKTGASGKPDRDGYEMLKDAYIHGGIEAMKGLDLSIAVGRHATMFSVAGLINDGERTAKDIEEIIEDLWAEYCVGGDGRDKGSARPGEIAGIAKDARALKPCEIEPFDLPPSFTDGLLCSTTQEGLDALIKERLFEKHKEAKEKSATAGNWFYKARDLVSTELPPQRILASTLNGTPVLRSSFLMELFAFRGVGKSAVAMGFAKLLLKGGEFLDYRSEGGAKVLYVDGELPLILLQDRIKTFIGDTAENLWFMSAEQLPDQTFPALIDPAVQAMFEERVEQLKPDVIILDTLSAVGKFDTNDSDSWRIFNGFLLRLRFKGYCVILVHHAGKNGTQRGLTNAEDNIDLVMQLTPPEGHDPGDGLKACVSYTKVRYGGRLQNFACEYVGGAWRMLVDSEEKEIIEMLNAGSSLKSVSTQLGVTIARVRKVRKQAKSRGLILSSTEIKKRKPVKTAEDLDQEKAIREAL